MSVFEKLQSYPLQERIDAVLEDVASGNDQFRSMEAHELADILGVPDAWRPGCEWDRIHFMRRCTLEECLDQGYSPEELLEWIKDGVSAERYQFLTRLIAKYAAKQEGFRLDVFSDSERRLIEDAASEQKFDQLESGQVVARYAITAPDGRSLHFEGLIEDDGDCIDLKTPYDHRDGLFTDFSNCVTETW